MKKLLTLALAASMILAMSVNAFALGNYVLSTDEVGTEEEEPIADASAVAVKIAPVSIPVAPRMLGLTARIYAMVMKVVRPAMTSVFTSVPCSFSLKKFSIVYLLLILITNKSSVTQFSGFGFPFFIFF